MSLFDLNIGGDVVPQPTEENIARRGPRRLVKLIPMPGNFAAPAIWTGPKFEDVIDKEKIFVVQCVLLVNKEPKPQTMLMTVPADFYDKCVDVPVEW